VRSAFHLPACGNATLEKCRRDTLSCPEGPRLSEFACWLAGRGHDSSFIAEKLLQRYRSLSSEQRYEIADALFAPAGDSAAPVVVTVYISIGCPACKQVCGFLYDSVTTGSLRGKAKLCVKLLTVTDRDIALLAADKCGMSWKFMKQVAAIAKRLDKPVLYDVAKRVGIPMECFEAAMNDEKLRERALASRREAQANGVTVTPTLFLNGRRYESYHHPDWITDAVDYEYRRIESGAGAR